MPGLAIWWEEWFGMPDPYLARYQALKREGGEVPHGIGPADVARAARVGDRLPLEQ